jgi:adenine/guanine/hypoxanthine permease
MDQVLGAIAPAAGGAAIAQTLRCLNNGFIVTSLLWGAALAALLDGRLKRSAVYLAIAAICSLFGIIHSPLRSQPIDFPWNIMARLGEESPQARFQTPYHWAAGYGFAVAFLLLVDLLPAKKKPSPEESKEEERSSETE